MKPQTNMPQKNQRAPMPTEDNRIKNLKNCIAANYGSALNIKIKLAKGEVIKEDDFDLGMILDRSHYHLENT